MFQRKLLILALIISVEIVGVAKAAAIITGEMLRNESWQSVSTAQTTSDGNTMPVGLGFFIDGSGSC